MPAKSEPESPIALKVKATWASISAAARLQTIFDETFKVQTEPVKHDKTAVLLLHWDEKVSDMDVSAEVFYFLQLLHVMCVFVLRWRSPDDDDDDAKLPILDWPS